MAIIALRYTTEENGDVTVFFDNRAELFAYCLCEEMTFNADGTVTLSGLGDVETPLLQQAIEAAARGKGHHVVIRTNDTEDVDGTFGLP